MTQIAVLPFMVYAACGLVASLAVHVLSLFGMSVGGNGLFFGLHIGIFPLWIPVTLITRKMMAGARRQDFWKIALSGCPSWMRYMTLGFLGYAFLNFAIFIGLVLMHPPPKGAAAPPAEVLHGFSGHWMAFYSAGLAILTTVYRGGFANLQRKCPAGHEIGWYDRFCPTCGAAVGPPVELN